MNLSHLLAVSVEVFPLVKLSFNNLPGHFLVQSLAGFFDVSLLCYEQHMGIHHLKRKRSNLGT